MASPAGPAGPALCLRRPYAVIDGLFCSQLSAASDAAALRGDWGVADTFRLHTAACHDEIPSLNDIAPALLCSDTLVRFRGMVQDFFPSEFVPAAVMPHDPRALFPTPQKFRDIADGPPTCPAHLGGDAATLAQPEPAVVSAYCAQFLERQPLYCVPIPAETAWAKEAYAMSSAHALQAVQQYLLPYGDAAALGLRAGKRARADRAAAEHCGAVGSFAADVDSFAADVDSFAADVDSFAADVASPAPKCPRATSVHADGSSGCANMETDPVPHGTSVAKPGPSAYDLNFPLPGERGPAVIVKMYDGWEGALKLNDVAEFVGVLTRAPDVALHSDAFDEFEHDELLAHHPPHSAVPRLHCLFFTKLGHANPALPSNGPQDITQHADLICEARGQLLDVLAASVGHDRLAAEYLLLLLLSKVHTRTDVLPLGSLPLNISNCSPRLAQHVAAVLGLLVPRVHCLALTLPAMCTGPALGPAKNVEQNKLRAGVLQLSAGTTLVIDETAVQPGLLDANGTRNIAALRTLVAWQHVHYDFGFHTTPFDTDLQLLVLSAAPKSVLDVLCHVALSPASADATQGSCACCSGGALPADPASAASPADAPSASALFQHGHHFGLHDCGLLARWRQYLAVLRACDDFVLDDAHRAMAGDDFVAARQADSRMSVDIFHLWLTLARLVGLSFGSKQLSAAHWQHMRALEAARTARTATQLQL